MDPVLLIDCNLEDFDSAPRFADLFPGPTVIARARQRALPASLDGFSGVLVTGSAASVVQPQPWQAAAEDLLRAAVAADRPVLGVCFGHQLVARALVGPHAVRRRETAEVGWLDVEITAPGDPILQGLAPIYTFVSHLDEVVPVPGLDALARTPECAVHALRIRDTRAWGVQFHLEMSLDHVRRVVEYRAGLHPDLAIDPDAMMAESADTEAAARQLFANFVAVF